MTAETNPTPVALHLQDVIVQGCEQAGRTTLGITHSKLWIDRARAVLARLYGRDGREIDFWCPRHNVDLARITPQKVIAQRLPQLERLKAMLTVSLDAAKIFIGHGRSAEWLKLYIFLSQTLVLPCDEFNIESTAGLQTASRIETMLTSARMAFLVMTAEDRHADDTTHARENVIHEVGLFQAKLGAARAIVLLENGCSRFSNLNGLTTIDFPSGDIMACSEKVRGVLARENVL